METNPDSAVTIACGPTIYRGDQYPKEFHGCAVIPEAGGNLVRLARIDSDGVHLEATNAFDQREWVPSTDERFRPVNVRMHLDLFTARESAANESAPISTQQMSLFAAKCAECHRTWR